MEAVFNWVDLGPDDALLGVLPLFHVLAQMANLLLPLVKGSRVVYLETLNTTELLRALTERERSCRRYGGGDWWRRLQPRAGPSSAVRTGGWWR